MATDVTYACAECGKENTKRVTGTSALPVYCNLRCLAKRNNAQRRGDRARVWRKYRFDDAMDAAIRTAWRSGKDQLKRLWQQDPRFERAGIPYAIVKRQCRLLGLVRAEPRSPWSPDEEATLLRLAHLRYSPERLVKAMRRQGYDRTWSACRIRLWRHEWDTRGGEWSLHEVAIGLGVDDHSVGRWADQGLLRARRCVYGLRTRRYVSTGELRRFIIAEPFLAATGVPDIPWLIYVLADTTAAAFVRRSAPGESAAAAGDA